MLNTSWKQASSLSEGTKLTNPKNWKDMFISFVFSPAASWKKMKLFNWSALVTCACNLFATNGSKNTYWEEPRMHVQRLFSLYVQIQIQISWVGRSTTETQDARAKAQGPKKTPLREASGGNQRDLQSGDLDQGLCYVMLCTCTRMYNTHACILRSLYPQT